MRQAWICLRAFLSHWQRRPFQLLTLLIGLIAATALWSGVQAINFQARQSYDKAADLLGGREIPILTSTTSAYFSDDYFARLRKAGWRVSPILEGDVHMGEKRYRLVGIDPLSYPGDITHQSTSKNWNELLAFIDPGRTLVNPVTFDDIDTHSPHWTTRSGSPLPPAVQQTSLPPGILIVDLGIAQQILDKSGLISKLLVSPAITSSVPDLAALGIEELRLGTSGKTIDLNQLTESFHLNLTAFGFLSFLVGLFIVRATIGLAFEQRRGMIRTLRACGVSARTLAAVLLIELLILAILAGSAGVIVGYGIAAALLPNVVASLQGLYGADVSGELSLETSWWLLGLLMSGLGALIAAAGSLYKTWRLPILAPAAPNAWRQEQQLWLRRQTGVAVLLFMTSFSLPFLFDGLISGFLMIGALLLGAALLLPSVLSLLMKIGGHLARRPVAQWFWADAQQQISGLSMALMALFLALSVNIGVGTMVESFRQTFLDWLDTRLVSDVYVRDLNDQQISALYQWPVEKSGIDAVLPIWKTNQVVSGWPTEIYGFMDHRTYRDNWSLINATDTVWADIASATGLLVSEQLARKLKLNLGDSLDLPAEKGPHTLKIVGIFPDYGNPKGMVMVNLDVFTRHWPSAPRNRFGLQTEKSNIQPLIGQLQQKIGLKDSQIIDQASLKSYSISVFEKTFAITLALNSLTLLVAGIAMFASLLSLSQIRLPQLAPLWAMGITRKSLALLELGKSLSLAAFTALFAIPFGVLLAWCLVAIVNVAAFGWRLPLFLFPVQWSQLFILTLLTAFLSSLFPIYRLYRIRADRLLKVFTDER